MAHCNCEGGSRGHYPNCSSWGSSSDIELAYKYLDQYIFKHLAYDRDSDFVGLMQSAAVALKHRIAASRKEVVS